MRNWGRCRDSYAERIRMRFDGAHVSLVRACAALRAKPARVAFIHRCIACRYVSRAKGRRYVRSDWSRGSADVALAACTVIGRCRVPIARLFLPMYRVVVSKESSLHAGTTDGAYF